ncbi:MAG: hypothetical protein OHK0057_09530 [Thermoflexibacter sp.]
MKDITNSQNIENLVSNFYQKVKQDKIIRHFFTSVVQLSWDTHIPIRISYWNTILFRTQSYKGNPMGLNTLIYTNSHQWKQNILSNGSKCGKQQYMKILEDKKQKKPLLEPPLLQESFKSKSVK